MNKVKVAILGEADVGKTSLLRRFVTGEFLAHSPPTLAADFLSKEVTIAGDSLTLQIWDTSGQERYRSLGAVFYRGAEVCVLAYDITDSRSFDALDGWKEEFLSLAGTKHPGSVLYFVVGMKADLEADRKVPFSRVQDWKRSGKCISHFECSAKFATNVEAAFREIAWWVLNTRKPADERAAEYEKPIVLSAVKTETTKKACC